MKISARNQLPGAVKSVTQGAVMAEVAVDRRRWPRDRRGDHGRVGAAPGPLGREARGRRDQVDRGHARRR